MLVGAARVTALHRRLHRDARQDALTGLGNRHRLAEDLEAMQARARALRPPLVRRARSTSTTSRATTTAPATSRATLCCAA